LSGYDRNLELSDHKDILSIVNFDTTDGDPSNLETGSNYYFFNIIITYLKFCIYKTKTLLITNFRKII